MPVSFSDHYAVGIIQQCNIIKGPRPWRFPSDMLSDESKVEDIKNRLCLFNENKPIDSWEWIKADIQRLASEFTAFRQKQMSREMKSIKLLL